MIPALHIALLACARIGAIHSVILGGFSAEALRDRIQDCESEILSGDPAETILRVVDIYNMNLIIMGTRGQGGIKSLLLGSQSHKVVSTALCPVMLVR